MKKFRETAQASFQSVAHSWAWGHYDNAESYNGDMYHHGNKIYSYGSHFEMARKVEAKDGTIYVYWRAESYSPTTSKHQSAVQQAIPSSWIQLDLKEFPEETKWSKERDQEIHLKNVRGALADASTYTIKQKRARSRDYSHEINYALNQAKQIAKLFKPKGLTKAEKDVLNNINNEVEAEAFDLITKSQTRQRKAAQTKISKKRAEQAKKDLILWREGANVSLPYNIGYLVRANLKTEMIETSANARVPMAEAKLLWGLINKTKNSDTNWKKNGKTFEIGHYSVDLIEAGTGTTIIGCHTLQYDEMNNLAESLGWN